MEVPLPEVYSRFNFSEPEELAKELEENQSGSYSWKLAEFVNSETQRLREQFMFNVPILREDPDAYDQVWTSSSDLIKRSLELFWYKRFEWDDIERGALELEKMEVELESKFSDFKREMDSFHETTPDLNSFSQICQKVMDMHRLLREMALKIYPLYRRDLRVDRGKFELFKCTALMDLSNEHDERIFGRLRWEILRRQIDFIADNFGEEHRASVRVVRDILPMGDFIYRWSLWLVEASDVKLLQLVLSRDLKRKQGKKVVKLMDQTWREMHTSLILPLEYWLVFAHPNRGKVPLDMLC